MRSAARALQVAGDLFVSPDLANVRLSAGTVSIHKNGALQLGTREEPFEGTFELQLNSSLHEFGPHAVSYLDVYGSLQLLSNRVDVPDGIVRSWKATDIKAESFVLEGSEQLPDFQAGTLLGIVSSHGEEVVSVSSYSRRKVSLTSQLEVAHGAKAIVYKLSHKIKITGSGSAAVRMWNGQPDAGGSVEEKPAAFHHHRRLMYSHTAFGSASPASTAVRQKTSWISSFATASVMHHSSRALSQGSSSTDKIQSDSGYQDTNIYKSSLTQQQLAGKVTLHGVEISGVGVSTRSAVQAGLSMIDYACHVRWPEIRKYVSLKSVSMHSLKAGCVEFQGCTGGLEVR